MRVRDFHRAACWAIAAIAIGGCGGTKTTSVTVKGSPPPARTVTTTVTTHTNAAGSSGASRTSTTGFSGQVLARGSGRPVTTAAQAESLARAAGFTGSFGGAPDLEHEAGRTIWSFDVPTGNVDLWVDAKTGEVLYHS
jgi:hypothetical protein